MGLLALPTVTSEYLIISAGGVGGGGTTEGGAGREGAGGLGDAGGGKTTSPMGLVRRNPALLAEAVKGFPRRYDASM